MPADRRGAVRVSRRSTSSCCAALCRPARWSAAASCSWPRASTGTSTTPSTPSSCARARPSADYDNPPYTIIGTGDPVAEAALRELYAGVNGPTLTVAPAVAELVKSVANAWHATKIAFANEIGRLAQALDVDGRAVMDVIMQDAKLNVSAAYLMPGYAYGGSCLPKDTRGLVFQGRERGVALPLLESLPASNRAQMDLAAEAVLERRPRHVLVCGLAFKHGTDDLRESPAVALVKRLIGEGCEVRIFDPDVRQSHLVGTNLAYIREHVPHFEALLVDDPAEWLAWADVAVVTYGSPDFAVALRGLPAATPRRRPGRDRAGDERHTRDVS